MLHFGNEDGWLLFTPSGTFPHTPWGASHTMAPLAAVLWILSLQVWVSTGWSNGRDERLGVCRKVGASFLHAHYSALQLSLSLSRRSLVSLKWAQTKKTLLQPLLGAERQWVLRTINVDNDATCDQPVTLLNEHRACCSGCSYFAGATSFSESNLRGLANSCEVGVLRNEMIRNQLIEHTNNEFCCWMLTIYHCPEPLHFK